MKFRYAILLLLVSLVLSGCMSLAEDLTPPPGAVAPTARPTFAPVFPSLPMSVENGSAIYTEKCAACHGDTGGGDGPQGAQLPNPPAQLSNPDLARAVAPLKWFAAVTQGNLEKFMPPFISLTEQERWDVVAYALSMSTTTAELEQGKAVYQANCAACHGVDGSTVPAADFSNQVYMAQLSAADLFQMTTQGKGDMPAFTGLPEADLWAVSAYMRSLTFESMAVAAAPSSTPEPTVSVEPSESPEADETPEGTPSAEASPEGTPSEEATASPEPAGTTTPEAALAVQTGTVTGQVLNGSGGTVPSGLTVTLLGFDHSTGAQPGAEQVLDLKASVKADNTYEFKDVELPEGRFYIVEVEFAGLNFSSDVGIVEPGTNTLDLPVTIYDMSTDSSALKAEQVHILFDFTNPDVVTVIEFHVLTNPGNSVISSAEPGQAVASFDLPEGFTNLLFEEGQLGGRFLPTDSGFADTVSILPGQGRYQVVFAFDLPYKRKLDLIHPIDRDIASLSVLVPQGVKVKGDLLTQGESRTFQNITFDMFNATGLKAGETLTLTVSGSPKTEAPATTGDSTRNGLLIGVGALGVALIAVGGWLFWRDRSKVEDEDFEDDEEIMEFESADEVMDAIIALDDAYRAGNLSEGAYQERRAELKELLKKFV